MCQQRTRSNKNTEDYGQGDNQFFHFPRLLKIEDPVERTIAVTFRAKRLAEKHELLSFPAPIRSGRENPLFAGIQSRRDSSPARRDRNDRQSAFSATC